MNHVIAEYTREIDSTPRLMETYNKRGIEYFKLKQYEKAIQDFSEVLRKSTSDGEYSKSNAYYFDVKALIVAEAYNNRGKVYTELKQYNEAIADFSIVIGMCISGRDFNCMMSTDPQSINGYIRGTVSAPRASAYLNRGIVFKKLNQYDKAIEDFNDSIRIQPQFEAYINRGLVFNECMQYDEALNDYTDAIEFYSSNSKTYPEIACAYNNRGIVYTILKQYEMAIKDFNQVLEIEPNYIDIYINLGNAFLGLGKSKQ